MSEYPEYHEQGMGCGLEDQNITNRYEACRYGYETALEDVNNDIVEPLEKENKRLREMVLEAIGANPYFTDDVAAIMNKLEKGGE